MLYKITGIAIIGLILNGCAGTSGSLTKTAPEPEKSIAPIFIHGKGIGLTGEDIPVPHVFLSENEAREIIDNELEKINVIFDKTDIEMKTIIIEKKMITLNKEEYLKGRLVSKEEVIDKKNLIMDRYCTEYNLGYEFISKEDYDDYKKKEYKSSIQGFDLKIIAEYLNNKLKEQDDVNAVVFYDPLSEINDTLLKKKLIK